MRIFALFILWGVGLASLSAQSAPEGLWEGTITIGGLESQEGHKFQVYLEARGRRLSGRTYIHLGEGRTIAMDVVGRMYNDRSIDLKEVRFIDTGTGVTAPFNRKYQMLYRRGLYDNVIEGFWQEIRPDSGSQRRERGRILLKKINDSKV